MRKSNRVLSGRSRRGWALAAGCVALAIGAIVLLRGQGRARERPRPEPPESTGTAKGVDGKSRIELTGPGVSGSAAFTQGAVLAGGKRELFADVRIEADGTDAEVERTPVAMGVVLDTSGSMRGDKIAEARRAVRQLVERMHEDDHVALILYDSSARILQPLAPVGEVREGLLSRIERVRASGGTNIPHGLSLGQQALREASDRHVRRMVLVSDGRDHSGMALHAVTDGVRRRADRGLTTSSLGIGVDYDERYLTGVADAGRGNYEFLSGGEQLRAFLTRELDEATATVVDEALAELELPDGWRLERAYGAEVERSAGALRVPFGALHAGERRRALLELTVDAGAPGRAGAMPVALGYRTVADDERHRLAPGELVLLAVRDESEVKARRDADLHAEAVATEVDARQAEALDAWQQGRREHAQQLARRNAGALRRAQANAPNADFEDRAAEFERDADKFSTQSAASAEGRAYKLESNAKRRARMRRAK